MKNSRHGPWGLCCEPDGKFVLISKGEARLLPFFSPSSPSASGSVDFSIGGKSTLQVGVMFVTIPIKGVTSTRIWSEGSMTWLTKRRYACDEGHYSSGGRVMMVTFLKPWH